MPPVLRTRGDRMPGSAQQLLDPLDRVEHVDEPRVVVVERAARHAAEALAEAAQLGVRAGRPHPVGDDHPGERPDAIHAVRVAQGLPVRGLEERPRLHGLADEVGVAARVDPVGEERAVGVHDPQQAVVVVDGAVAVDEPHVRRAGSRRTRPPPPRTGRARPCTRRSRARWPRAPPGSRRGSGPASPPPAARPRRRARSTTGGSACRPATR